MNSEKKGDSSDSGDIPSTDTVSKLETTKLPQAGPKDTNPAASIATEATETPQAVEAIERSVDADGSPSLLLVRERRTDEAASSVAATQQIAELLEAGPEDASPSAPMAIAKPEAVETTRQQVNADGSPSLLMSHEPRTDEAASSVAVKSASVKRPQGFFGEQPFPIIETAPRVLRYRSRRDVLLFSAGVVAAVAGVGSLLPQTTLSRMGVQRN